MHSRLQPVVAVLAVLIGVTLCWAAVTEARALWWQESVDVDGVRRSLSIDATNAQAHFKLGHQLLSLQESEESITELEKAVALDPGICYAWLELAAVRRTDLQLPQAKAALSRAYGCDRHDPELQFEVASERFALGDNRRALQSLHEIAQNDDARREEALDIAWRETRSLPTVLSISAREPRDYDSLLTILMYRQAFAQVPRLIDAAVAARIQLPRKTIVNATDLLIGSRKFYEAASIWRAANVLQPELAPYATSDQSPVTNADFSAPILGQGFDWRIEPSSQIEVQQGEGGLAVRFSLARPETILEQYVWMPAMTRYRLTVHYDCRELVTASPVRVAVVDARGENIAALPLSSCQNESAGETSLTTSANPSGWTLQLQGPGSAFVVNGTLRVRSIRLERVS